MKGTDLVLRVSVQTSAPLSRVQYRVASYMSFVFPFSPVVLFLLSKEHGGISCHWDLVGTQYLFFFFFVTTPVTLPQWRGVLHSVK